ncbi:MAG: epoxyqueuosine reductase [Candidatus Tectomicrobia bacterium]|uniref:Epoxyqueuosine reductase n=1 Tax=Tectimicrobiota bacterium TaxID=2528274 RepID=A0A933GMD7_UNCTE|nr:epoxyqueuosine reductase [Candidatus Tectomicrobia bacterium]
MGGQQPKEWIENLITDFVLHSEENTLQNKDNEKAWEEALIGFSSGADPLYEAYKEYVGPFHFTPHELFSRTFPDEKVQPDQLTVISYILPQTEATKSDNRKEKSYPSERWARARIFGETVNQKLRQHVVGTLERAGYKAVAPQLSSLWEWKVSERYVFASTWSERHAAYASGLGTFGLCDGLITPKGKAMRCGSVIANIQIPPTVRPYRNHQEYCLFYSQGKCMKCILRCPAGAITEAGHDKIKCRSYLNPGTADYVKAHYHFDGYGCGLCQTGVPCESKIPTIRDMG